MSTARVFSGTALAGDILAALRADAATQSASLLVFRDPESPPAQSYANRIESSAEAAGLPVILRDYPASRATFEAELSAWAGAVLPMHPLPDWTDAAEMSDMLGPARDAEGLHPLHAGRLALGRAAIVPPTAAAALLVAETLAGRLSGRRVALVGASPVVGRPLALLLIASGATLRIAQVTTRDLAAETRDAEIVISAAGVPRLIGRDHLGPGAICIDIGMTREDDRLSGDIDPEAADAIAACRTHVPDGVGPVTVACLLRNAVTLAATG